MLGTWPQDLLLTGSNTQALGLMQIRTVGDPSPEAWSRFRRYASWIRQIHVHELSNAGSVFHKLRLNSPTGGWFPALQHLSWHIAESDLPYTDLFFSPHLKRISIRTPGAWNDSEVPHNVLPAIASAISALPTSTLQYLFVDISYEAPPSYFKDTLSSVILRCGPSLKELTSLVPLSDAAVNHLIRFPHLCIWRIEGPPPSYSPSSLPLVFPPLTELTLGGGVTCGWLSLFRRLEDSASTTRGVTPLSEVKKSLKSLDVKNPSPIIDVSFISAAQIFQNLAYLGVGNNCRGGDEVNECAFRINDDDVARLATALPRLESIFLGSPCPNNTCATTVACLLQISVRCLKLRELTIHFKTTNIVGDLENISDDPRFREIRLLPRCTLPSLLVGDMPLALDEPDFETVASGMIDIFPSLWCCSGFERIWDRVTERIVELQET